MHRRFEKDYRYLLSRLIPRHLLSSNRLERVLDALAGGDRAEMLREAFLSMEELVEKGAFRHFGRRISGETVAVTYADVNRPTRITLEMSREEWRTISGERRPGGGVVPSVLAGIISSLSLNNSAKTLANRIEELLGLVTHVEEGAEGNLLLFKEVNAATAVESARLHIASLEDVASNRFYSRSIGMHLRHDFIRIDGARGGKSVFPVRQRTGSVILVPLAGRRIKWGILEVHSRRGGEPDQDTLFNLHLLAKGIERLLENNSHLERMVSIDRLTGINNRNFYEIQLPLEIERANRTRKNLGFLIIDIDYFKRINDLHGHDVGDEMLKLIARTVRRSLRRIDLLFRYGGEEFIVLLPGAGREAAERTAERIREVVARVVHVTEEGEEIRPTISVGGCVYPNDGQNESELFRVADQALYRSKNEGRNRVTFHGAHP